MASKEEIRAALEAVYDVEMNALARDKKERIEAVIAHFARTTGGVGVSGAEITCYVNATRDAFIAFSDRVLRHVKDRLPFLRTDPLVWETVDTVLSTRFDAALRSAGETFVQNQKARNMPIGTGTLEQMWSTAASQARHEWISRLLLEKKSAAALRGEVKMEVTEAEQAKAKEWEVNRSRFLKATYDRAKRPAPIGRVNLTDIRAALDVDEETADTLVEQLQADGLVEFVSMGGLIGLTMSGIHVIEDLIQGRHPETRLEYSLTQFLVQGNMADNIVVGNQGDVSIRQEVVESPEVIREEIQKLYEKVTEVLGTGEEYRDLKATLDSLMLQAQVSKPKKGILRSIFDDLKEQASALRKDKTKEGILLALKVAWEASKGFLT